MPHIDVFADYIVYVCRCCQPRMDRSGIGSGNALTFCCLQKVTRGNYGLNYARYGKSDSIEGGKRRLVIGVEFRRY